jgi:hypothetical protein
MPFSSQLVAKGTYFNILVATGGLISDFFNFGSNLPKNMPNHYPDSIVYSSKKKALFGDWSQHEKVSSHL